MGLKNLLLNLNAKNSLWVKTTWDLSPEDTGTFVRLLVSRFISARTN